MCEFFDSYDIGCVCVRNAVDFERELGRGFYAALIDINLQGGVDGLTLLKRIKQDFPEMFTIVMTARDIQDKRIESIALGADAFLGKPIDLVELAKILKLTRPAVRSEV